jgi:uncharacterized membrane protein
MTNRWFEYNTEHMNAALNIRNRLVSGILIIVPFAVTIVIIRWLFVVLTGFLRPIVDKVLYFLRQIHLIQELPQSHVEYVISFATILSLLLLLYLVGAFARFVTGRRLLSLGEMIILHIPFARTIYTAAKQVATAVSLPENKTFTSVVLVEFPRSGFYSVGFLTGSIRNLTGAAFCKVFIPTTPNFTSGFFVLVPSKDVLKTSLTVEEAFKMIVSVGILSPEVLKTTERIT